MTFREIFKTAATTTLVLKWSPTVFCWHMVQGLNDHWLVGLNVRLQVTQQKRQQVLHHTIMAANSSHQNWRWHDLEQTRAKLSMFYMQYGRGNVLLKPYILKCNNFQLKHKYFAIEVKMRLNAIDDFVHFLLFNVQLVNASRYVWGIGRSCGVSCILKAWRCKSLMKICWTIAIEMSSSCSMTNRGLWNLVYTFEATAMFVSEWSLQARVLYFASTTEPGLLNISVNLSTVDEFLKLFLPKMNLFINRSN